MKHIFSANSLWGVVAASSLMSKVILLLASVGFIVCTFVFIYKFLLIREKMRQIFMVRSSLQSTITLNDVLSLGTVLKGTLPGAIIGKGLKTLKLLLQGGDGEKSKLTPFEFDLLSEALDQALQAELQKEYEGLPLLSVSAGVAPLVGLFGTISGLIQAFIAIGQQRSTDITTIAPGIAEALLTTFAGLVVAIPAYVMFYYLSNAVAKLEHELAALISQFEWSIKHVLKG